MLTCQAGLSLPGVVPRKQLLRDCIPDVMSQHMRAGHSQVRQKLLSNVCISVDGVRGRL